MNVHSSGKMVVSEKSRFVQVDGQPGGKQLISPDHVRRITGGANGHVRLHFSDSDSIEVKGDFGSVAALLSEGITVY